MSTRAGGWHTARWTLVVAVIGAVVGVGLLAAAEEAEQLRAAADGAQDERRRREEVADEVLQASLDLQRASSTLIGSSNELAGCTGAAGSDAALLACFDEHLPDELAALESESEAAAALRDAADAARELLDEAPDSEGGDQTPEAQA